MYYYAIAQVISEIVVMEMSQGCVVPLLSLKTCEQRLSNVICQFKIKCNVGILGRRSLEYFHTYKITFYMHKW